jgi:hypothetical protein
MNKAAIVGITLVLVIILTGTAFFIRRSSKLSVNPSPTPTPVPTATSTPIPTPTPSVPDDWQIYEPDSNWSISYPKKMQTRENQDGSVSFILLGPTQTQGTEVYDGIIFTVETGVYTENSFQSFAENGYQENADEPTTSEITDLTQVSIQDKKAYQYTVTSLGEFTHIYIQGAGKTYAHISMLIEDPGDESFQEIADKMLDSLSF